MTSLPAGPRLKRCTECAGIWLASSIDQRAVCASSLRRHVSIWSSRLPPCCNVRQSKSCFRTDRSSIACSQHGPSSPQISSLRPIMRHAGYREVGRDYSSPGASRSGLPIKTHTRLAPIWLWWRWTVRPVRSRSSAMSSCTTVATSSTRCWCKGRYTAASSRELDRRFGKAWSIARRDSR